MAFSCLNVRLFSHIDWFGLVIPRKPVYMMESFNIFIGIIAMGYHFNLPKLPNPFLKYFKKGCPHSDFTAMNWSSYNVAPEKSPINISSAATPATAWLKGLKSALDGNLKYTGDGPQPTTSEDIVSRFLEHCESWYRQNGGDSEAKVAAVYLLMLHKMNYSYRNFSFKQTDQRLVQNELFRKIGHACCNEHPELKDWLETNLKSLDGILAVEDNQDKTKIQVFLEKVIDEVRDMKNQPFGDPVARVIHDAWHGPYADRRAARIDADLHATPYKARIGERIEGVCGATINHLPLLPFQLLGSVLFAVWQSRNTSAGAAGGIVCLKASFTNSGVAEELRLVKNTLKRDNPSETITVFASSLEALRGKTFGTYPEGNSAHKIFIAQLINVLHALNVNGQKIQSNTNQQLKDMVMDQIHWHLMLTKSGKKINLGEPQFNQLKSYIDKFNGHRDIRRSAHKASSFKEAMLPDDFVGLFGESNEAQGPFTGEELKWILMGPKGCHQRDLSSGGLLNHDNLNETFIEVLEILRRKFNEEITDVIINWPIRLKWGNSVLMKRFLRNGQFKRIYEEMTGTSYPAEANGVEAHPSARSREVAEAFIFGAVLAFAAPMVLTSLLPGREVLLAGAPAMGGVALGGGLGGARGPTLIRP